MVKKMRDATVCKYGFQNQDFVGTLDRVMGRAEFACPADTCAKDGWGSGNSNFFRTGSNDDKTDELFSASLDIDRELVHLMQNNTAYRSTTERLLQKMVLFTHAIDQGGN